MRRVLVLLALALAVPAAASAQARRPVVDVFALPEFREATKEATAEELFEAAAVMHVRLRQYRQAIPLLEALVKDITDRSDLWMLLAIAYNRIDEPREAWDAANIAIALAPDTTLYYGERGVAAVMDGRDADGVRDLSRFLAAYRANARGHLYRGIARARLGEHDAAREDLDRASALNPRLALVADYYVGLVAARTGRTLEAQILLRETLEAFEGVETPFKETVRAQLKALEAAEAPQRAAAARRLREALVTLDAEHSLKHLPRPSAP